MTTEQKDWEEKILKTIDSGEDLEEYDIRELIWENAVFTEYGEDRRWSRTNTTLVEIQGRYFVIDWEEGLTENQDSAYLNQPIEVSSPEEQEVKFIRKSWKDGEGNVLISKDEMAEG